MNYLIKNVRTIDAHTNKIQDVYIEDGKISDHFHTDENTVVIDGTGKTLFPGLIDPHVHFREPGFEYKEDIESGSKAALSAGVTGYFEMPNTEPPTFTRELLIAKKAIAAKNSHANYGFYFGSGPDNQAEIEAVTGVPGTKLYLNTTTGNLRMDQESRWREIFNIGKKVALHAEGETFQRAVDVWLEEGAPCPLHLCHASLRSEVELVRRLKNDDTLQAQISMEACPHHLFMTHKDREKHGAYCCMKPELATQDDCDALWEGILDNTIDCFATDHAPHTKEEKESDQIFYGIPGVETLFHLVYTEFVNKGYDLQRFAAMTSYNIYDIFAVPHKKGLIKAGYDGDVILVDPSWEGIVSTENFHSKCQWTPFAGRSIKGQIQTVWLDGKIAFEQKTQAFTNQRGQDLF